MIGDMKFGLESLGLNPELLQKKVGMMDRIQRENKYNAASDLLDPKSPMHEFKIRNSIERAVKPFLAVESITMDHSNRTVDLKLVPKEAVSVVEAENWVKQIEMSMLRQNVKPKRTNLISESEQYWFESIHLVMEMASSDFADFADYPEDVRIPPTEVQHADVQDRDPYDDNDDVITYEDEDDLSESDGFIDAIDPGVGIYDDEDDIDASEFKDDDYAEPGLVAEDCDLDEAGRRVIRQFSGNKTGQRKVIQKGTPAQRAEWRRHYRKNKAKIKRARKIRSRKPDARRASQRRDKYYSTRSESSVIGQIDSVLEATTDFEHYRNDDRLAPGEVSTVRPIMPYMDNIAKNIDLAYNLAEIASASGDDEASEAMHKFSECCLSILEDMEAGEVDIDEAIELAYKSSMVSIEALKHFESRGRFSKSKSKFIGSFDEYGNPASPTFSFLKTKMDDYLGDDPTDIAEELGSEYGWSQKQIDQAEQVIRKHFR